MQCNIKQTNIKHHLYYYFDDMINAMTNIKNFDPNLLEINLVFSNVDKYIEEKNELKYLIFTFTDKKKEILKIT